MSNQYWFYYEFCEIEQKMYIFWYGILNYDESLSLIIFFSPISNQWFFGIFCHNVLKQSKKYKNFDFQYWSAATFKVSQFVWPKSREQQTVEQYQGLADRGELYLKSFINRLASGKLCQSITVSIQFGWLSYPLAWLVLHFGCWYHFEKHCGFVFPIMCKQT